jgi:hypothetical protein
MGTNETQSADRSLLRVRNLVDEQAPSRVGDGYAAAVLHGGELVVLVTDDGARRRAETLVSSLWGAGAARVEIVDRRLSRGAMQEVFDALGADPPSDDPSVQWGLEYEPPCGRRPPRIVQYFSGVSEW